MKDDEQLNKYYGVNYDTWYDDILVTYSELNQNLGALQGFEIVAHRTVIAERTQEEGERKQNYALLEQEFIASLRATVEKQIADQLKLIKAKYPDKYKTLRLKVTVDVAGFSDQFKGVLESQNLVEYYDEEVLVKELNKIKAEYEAEYRGDPNVTAEMYENKNDNADWAMYADCLLNVSNIPSYTSQYKFYTKSECTLDIDSYIESERYQTTEYTLDNDKVVIVKYQKGALGDADYEVCYFILNYNIYSVNVVFNGQSYTIAKYGYEKI